jgi:NAD(P)-dependent dehydrogenase (short-subunit alcohol dehydrogenase family)
MKKVLIWGCEGGIGRAILSEFDRQGWQVAGAARKITGLSADADWTYEADFRDPEQVRVVAEDLRQRNLGFDAFVFAGGDIGAAKVREADPDRWEQILDNNLTAVFQTLHASLPLLIEDAHVFLLGAVSERLQLPGLTAYVAAKAGLEAMSVALRKEERQKKFSVIRPGAVDTDLWDKVPFKKPAHTYPPAKVAEKIWQAYQEGHQGTLDLLGETGT